MIGEDLFIASGQTTVADSGEVGEDLVFGSGRMTMSGTVGGDVLGAAGDYDRQGTVAGTENVTVREVEAPRPPIGSWTRCSGSSASWWSPHCSSGLHPDMWWSPP